MFLSKLFLLTAFVHEKDMYRDELFIEVCPRMGKFFLKLLFALFHGILTEGMLRQKIIHTAKGGARRRLSVNVCLSGSFA